MSRDEFFAHLCEHGVAAAPVLSVQEVFEDDEVAYWDMIHAVPVPHADLPIFGLPTARHVFAPKLDEQGDEVRAKGWAALE